MTLAPKLCQRRDSRNCHVPRTWVLQSTERSPEPRGLRAPTVLYSLHPLLEDRVPPGLTDDQISPLHHDDTDKEGCVASELHDLPLFIGLKHKRQTDEPGSWPSRLVA